MTATTRNIIEELKRAATEQGAGEAVRTIAGPALETWMRALDGKDADPERLDDLATLMTARLSIRDAALIAAVEPKLDTATVIDMAARPHASNNKTLLTETLKAAFDDPHIRPDETRLARAVREACAMADRARKHGGPVAQPYALAAYLAAANPALTGVAAHEWLGLGIGLVLLVHGAQHVDFAGHLLTSRGAWRAKGRILLDAALVLSVAVVVLSGLMESGTVLPAFGFYAEGYYFWGPLHAASAKVLLALLVVHGALNLGSAWRLAQRARAKEDE